MNRYLLAAILFVVTVAIDAFVLAFVLKGFFDVQLAGFERTLRLAPALAAWALIAFGVVFFVLPKSASFGSAATIGALFGLVLYGVYDFTNYAILAQYRPAMVAADIAWGMTLCAGLSIVAYALGSQGLKGKADSSARQGSGTHK